MELPKTMNRRFHILAAFILAAFSLTVAATNSLNAETSKPTSPAPASPQAKAPSGAIPGPRQLNLLIRTTVIAFNQANQTGNYSVLRDLGAPGFQQSNTPAKLSLIFAKIRARKLDLSPILFFDPKLIRQPYIQPNGLLRLSGFFNTRPERVVFDLQFQLVGPAWRLFGISVETHVSEDATANAPQRKATPKKQSETNNAASKSGRKKAPTTKNKSAN